MTTFGIEIEISTQSNNRALGTLTGQLVAATITSHGVACTFAGYTHQVSSTWKVVTDSSCGLEVVSPILDPRNGDGCYDEIRKVCAALNLLGAKVTAKTGFHVHLGVAHLTPRTVAKFVGSYFRLEHLADLAMPKSRRGSSNSYCKSCISSFNLIGGRTSYGTLHTGTDLLTQVNVAIAATRSARTWSEVKAIVNYAGDRFHKLNMMAFDRQGTIEIRHAAGTTQPEKIIMWCRFLQTMLRRAETSTFVRNLLTTDLPSGTAWHALWCLDDREAVTWFRNRLLKFAAIETQMQDEDLILANAS